MKPREELISRDDLVFLRELTQAVLDASTVFPGQFVGSHVVNALPIPVMRPGGGEGYPAFWVRDMVMSVESGLIPNERLLSMFLLLAGYQTDRKLEPSPVAEIPAGAVPDHICLDGTSCFYPGENAQQHLGIFGRRPPYDDQFYLIHLGWFLVSRAKLLNPVRSRINGKTVLERLDTAFAVPPADGKELVCNTGREWAIGFGFTDTVKHTGSLLFASLLRFRAALEMAQIHQACGFPEKAEEYQRIAEVIQLNLAVVFEDRSGLLRASTGESCQPDVWGSAFAVRLGVLPEAESHRVAEALAELYRQGRLSCGGAIRHVPLGMEFLTGKQCWETPILPIPFNTYQHGAYWSTPTGHVARAIARVDPAGARQLVGEFISHLREKDFRRKRPDMQAPYECFFPESGYSQNPIYLTSVSVPLAEMSLDF